MKKMEKKLIHIYRDLEVDQIPFEIALRIFCESKSIPTKECYSLIDQVCRSSRSVDVNISEAYRKRRYELFL